MKYSILYLILFLTALANAQDTGSIVGKIIDKEANDEPLAFANILIKGTTKGTTTDFDGLYEIGNVAPGVYTLSFSYLGYETVELPNITVEAGKVTTINIPMSASEGVSLQEVVVTTTARKDSEAALLLDQKKAVEIKTSIGAQELARKGVNDAEGAVTKVTGVSKQEGVKNVFVRGLGDRYNSTTLNGLPLPSEDPEYKNISLDFFSTDVINSVGINKTFSSNFYGDVAGANIDVVSKELTGGSNLTLNVSTGVNTGTLNKEFFTKDGTSTLGKPINLSIPIIDLNTYSFNNNINTNSQNLQLNNNISISGGKKYQIGENNSFSMFFVGSIDGGFLFKEGESSVVNPAGGLSQSFNYNKYEYNVTKLGMASLKYTFSNRSSLSYQGLVIHRNAQSVGEYTGFSTTANDDISDPNASLSFLRRQQVNDNQLFVNQLLSTLNIKDNISLDLGASYNFINGNEPDRTSFLHSFDGTNYSPITGSAGANSRFYSNLREDDIAGRAVATFDLSSKNENDQDLLKIVKAGYNYRNTQREFNFTQFNHDFRSRTIIDINNPDALYNQQNLSNGTFELLTLRGRVNNAATLAPFFYTGDKIIHSGFADFTYSLNSNIVLFAGLRYEKLNQIVRYETNLATTEGVAGVAPSEIDENYILPNLNAKYTINDNSILRLSASKSYTLPQFKEVAPFLYEDISISSFGNTKLLPSDDYNADVKWEYYLSSNEIIAVTGFYKKIINPINRTQVNSAANETSYVNTGNANIAGAELEIRKKIFEIENENEKSNSLIFGLNISYLHSKQELIDVDTDDLTVRFTDSTSKLEGAAPLLVNTDLTYNLIGEKSTFTTSAVLNYFSDRVYSLGVATKQNIIETAIPTFDLINKFSFGKNAGISLNFRNILDPTFKLTQELDAGNTVNVSSFKKGLNISLGFSYKF